MARFVTRVELHAGSPSDYSILHSAMAAEGFRQTITSGNGTVYQLPLGEYYREGTIERADVLQAAQRAAGKTRKEFAVLVTEAQVCTWVGLKVVQSR